MGNISAGAIDLSMEAAARRSLERSIGGGWRHVDLTAFGLHHDVCLVHAASGLQVIASVAEWAGAEWIHASIAHRDRDPLYSELRALHAAVFGSDRYAFQVFAPEDRHVNLQEHAIHLWGKVDGTNPLPDFGVAGTI